MPETLKKSSNWRMRFSRSLSDSPFTPMHWLITSVLFHATGRMMRSCELIWSMKKRLGYTLRLRSRCIIHSAFCCPYSLTSDSDRKVPTDLGQESQALSWVEAWNSACLSRCSRGDRPLVERYLEPGGLFPTMHGRVTAPSC